MNALESSPIALAFIAAIFFGLAISVAQRGVKGISTLAGAAVANLSGAALFWAAIPVYWDTNGADLSAIALFLLIGLFFPATVTLLMLESNRRMGPSVTATISGTTPLFVYAGAILFLAEALVARGFAGTLAIAGGVAVLAWRAPRLMGGYATWILLIPAAAALIRAIAQLLTKYSLLLWPNVFVAIVIGYTLSTAVVWGLVWIKRERIPRHRTLAFIVLSGCCNAIGVLAMFAAFRVGEATVVAPIVATSPLFTLLASTMITRDEMLTWRMCLGVCLIVAGAGLIVSR